MIVIKTSLKIMPYYCDDCTWHTTRPHPERGWTEICELESHSMDDDQPAEWIYDGYVRPEACPLMEVEDEHNG